jgi:hypothetical protein
LVFVSGAFDSARGHCRQARGHGRGGIFSIDLVSDADASVSGCRDDWIFFFFLLSVTGLRLGNIRRHPTTAGACAAIVARSRTFRFRKKKKSSASGCEFFFLFTHSVPAAAAAAAAASALPETRRRGRSADERDPNFRSAAVSRGTASPAGLLRSLATAGLGFGGRRVDPGVSAVPVSESALWEAVDAVEAVEEAVDAAEVEAAVDVAAFEVTDPRKSRRKASMVRGAASSDSGTATRGDTTRGSGAACANSAP